jgi:hypothetical protein
MAKRNKEDDKAKQEQLHEDFSQKLANKIYINIEKLGDEFQKKHKFDTAISTFNTLLSISTNCAVELGVSKADFIEICKEFWDGAEASMQAEHDAYNLSNDEPKVLS